jgi:hypothetical protein
MFALSKNSPMFLRMDAHFQAKSACHFGAAIWFLFYFPISIQILKHVFDDIHSDQLHFLVTWGSYSAVMLKAGMLDQMFELIVRKWDWSLHLHHYGELIFALLFLDFVPVKYNSTGLYLFCLLSALDRVVHFVHAIHHLVKEREMFINERLHGDMIVPPYSASGFDAYLPTTHALCRWYYWSFMYYVVFLRTFIIVLVAVFCVYQWSFLTLFWKVLYFLMTLLFILVDIECYSIIWKRTQLREVRKKTLINTIEMTAAGGLSIQKVELEVEL